MIIYENTIDGFIKDRDKGADFLVAHIKTSMREKMGRGVSPSEERSWRTTLVKIAEFFKEIKEKDKQYILLEFKVPTTHKRIDVILVGSDGIKKSILIIELKGWSESTESDIKDSLDIKAIYGHGVAHPSREAEEYKYLLKNRFSDISKEFENIEAISLLPNYKVIDNDPILASQFEKLIEEIKIYHSENVPELKQILFSLFSKGIERKDVEFLNKLEYKPSLDFQKHLENEFKDIKLSISQKLAYEKIVHEINVHISKPTNKKLITISGLPGSGKTVVAFKILGYIYTQLKITAKLQLPGPEFRDNVKSSYNNTFTDMIGGAYSKSEAQVIIVDEAHKATGQGTAKQYYKELFAQSNFVIALLDDNQVVNKKGITKTAVHDFSRKANFDIIDLELRETFRTSGDSLYIDWLKNWIHNNDEENMQDEFVKNAYDFDVLSEKEFHEKYSEMFKNSVTRMGSFWTQPWNAEMNEQGFPIAKINVGTKKYIWNINNYWIKDWKSKNPNGKVSKYINKLARTNFNNPELRKIKGPEYIAYFNTIQGSEFENFFVHIPRLFFLNDKNELDVDLSQLDMNEMKYQIWTKNGKPVPEEEYENKLFFKNRLFVNLSRGTKGTYVYCEDEKLSNWIKNKVRR
ncbi:MAG: DUF2075 domain-containing protein [Mycoplasmataceae bacterium]|nr:DUF2075 domain-containing protein [Mycoplasmataceae bacterium]